jgi:multidrug resistance efflux pump
MLIFIFIIYLAIVWVIFDLLKLAKLDFRAKVIIVGIGLAICASILFAVQVLAPSSSNLMVYQYIVQIAPRVGGRVIEVPITPNVPIKKGQVLFKIDPEPYQAEVNRLSAALAEAEQAVPQLKASVKAAKGTLEKAEARLVWAKVEYEKTAHLVASQALRQVQIDKATAELRSAEAAVQEAKAKLQQSQLAYESEVGGEHTMVAKARAELAKAEIDLEETTVHAPSDGFVVNLQLRPGSIVSGLPTPVMTFVEKSDSMIVALVKQNALSLVKPGNQAEIILDMYPGRIFAGEVETVVWASGQGQLTPGGDLPEFFDQQPRGLFAVRLKARSLPRDVRLTAGAGGMAAIYTYRGKPFHMVRKVIIRMRTWLNYLFLS